jgi:hypothetical protein
VSVYGITICHSEQVIESQAERRSSERDEGVYYVFNGGERNTRKGGKVFLSLFVLQYASFNEFFCSSSVLSLPLLLLLLQFTNFTFFK